MERLKKQIRKLLPVIVVIVPAMAAISACRNEYYTYTRYFKIEEIHMTRISIDSFPVDSAVMYLVESAISDCPPETIKSDEQNHAIPPYAGGSIDTITSVEFTNNGKPVHPIRLHWQNCREIMPAAKGICVDTTQQNWQNCADTLDAAMCLYSAADETYFPMTVYESDCRNIPKLMMGVTSLFNRCSYDTCYNSFNYLICFDKKSPLPDIGYVKCKNRDIKISINNTLKKLKIVGNISYKVPTKYMY